MKNTRRKDGEVRLEQDLIRAEHKTALSSIIHDWALFFGVKMVSFIYYDLGDVGFVIPRPART